MTPTRHPLRAGLAAAALAATPAAPASAGWTPPVAVPLSASVGWTEISVDARGDLAVAGVRESGARHDISAVVVALRPVRGSAFSVRTLTSARASAIAGLTMTVDRRGTPTVAWVERRSSGRVVRSAFRAADGRWVLQTVGATSAFFNVSPRVAATPDGTVVLTYYAHVARAPGMAAAWRSRGGRFGAVQALRAGTRRGAYLTEPALAFDGRGTAFLAGAAGCGQAPSTGVLYTGSARARRFAPGKVVARAPAQDVRMAATGSGTVVLGWLTGNCTPGREDYTGMPMAAVVRDGRPGAPIALAATPGYLLTLAGAPAGGAMASWAVAGTGAIVTTTISSGGSASPAHAPEGGWVPVAADARGDQLLRQAHASGTFPFEPLAAASARGGPPDPAPILAAGFPWGAGTATAGDGSALAALSVSGTRRIAAVWRP